MDSHHPRAASSRRSLKHAPGGLWLGACLCASTLAAAPTDFALPPQPPEVYVLGDSGSEMGNLFALPGYAPGPNAPYWRGPDGFLRHSSGPKWVEVLFPGMRVSSDTTRTGERVNYAYDGAMTNEWVGGFPVPTPHGMLSQLADFTAEVAAGRLHPTTRSAFVLDIGPNDCFEALTEGTDLAAASTQVAQNIATTIRSLNNVVRAAKPGTEQPVTFFVNEVPDFSEAPLFLDLYASLPADLAAANRTALHDLATDSREQVRSTLLNLRGELGPQVNIVTIPFDTFYTALRANPAAWGFTNVTDPVYDDTTGTVRVGPAEQEKYVFIDWLHLTATGERAAAQYIAQVVDAVYGGPQQRVARLADTGLYATESIADAQLSAPRERLEGDSRWSRFASVAAGYRRADLPGSEGRTEIFPTTLNAGLVYTPGQAWSFGGGLSYVNAPTRVNNKALRADLQGYGAALFAERRFDWATFCFSSAFTRLTGDTRRDVYVPTMRADGSAAIGTWRSQLLISRTFAASDWLLTAETGATWAYAQGVGFTEKGAPGLNLRYEDFHRASAQFHLGGRIQAPEWHWGAVAFRPSLGLTAAYEAGDKRTGVRAQLLDNTADPTFGYADNGRRFRLGAAPELAIAFPHGMQLALRGHYETDADNWHDAGGSCDFSYRF